MALESGQVAGKVLGLSDTVGFLRAGPGLVVEHLDGKLVLTEGLDGDSQLTVPGGVMDAARAGTVEHGLVVVLRAGLR